MSPRPLLHHGGQRDWPGVASLRSFWKVQHGAGQRGNSEQKHCGVEPSLNHSGPELCARWSQAGVQALTPHIARPPAWGSPTAEHAGGLGSGAGPASDCGDGMLAPVPCPWGWGTALGSGPPRPTCPSCPGSAPHRPRPAARSPAPAWGDPHCQPAGAVYQLSTCPDVDKQTEDKLSGEERQPGQWAKGADARLACLPAVYLLFRNARLPSPRDEDAKARGVLQGPDLGSGNLVGCCRDRRTARNMDVGAALPAD